MPPTASSHRVVAAGLDPDFLGDIAGFSGLDSRDVLDFAGIDRATVSRRKASGSALPQDADVEALQMTDLLTQATEVFGSPAQASTWPTRPHPSLDGVAPLKRAHAMGPEQGPVDAPGAALRRRCSSIAVFGIGLAAAKTVHEQAYGSALAPGRWHSPRTGPLPRRVIYCAGTRALAHLEKRVHANGIAPIGQALLRLELPDGLVVPTAQATGLPDHWRDSEATTQALGDRWLDTGAELALWVPSFVEPAEHKLLINAQHPRLAEIALVTERDPFEFNPRLA